MFLFLALFLYIVRAQILIALFSQGKLYYVEQLIGSGGYMQTIAKHAKEANYKNITI